jgi:chromate transport protein ChrA
MFRARPARRSSAVDADGRPVEVAPQSERPEGGVGAFGQVGGFLARLVWIAVSIVVVIIVAGILLVVLKANPSNSIVSEVHSWARSLAGPFDGMFSFRNANDAIAVNWGIAAVVYLFAAMLIVWLLGGTRRWRPQRRRYVSDQEAL